MTITKEKEFIILAENGRQRKININTGEYIGVRGQEIQKLPSTFYKQIYSDRENKKDIEAKNFYGALLYILSSFNRNDLEAKQHRLVVLRGTEFCNFLKINMQEFYPPYLTLILENKKDFSAWVKENQVETFNYGEHNNFARFLKEKEYEPIKKHFNEDSPITLRQYIDYFHNYTKKEEHITFVLYYLNNNITMFGEVMGYIEPLNSFNANLIKKYFKACEELNKKPEKTRDLAREILETLKTAEFVRHQKEAEKVKAIYEKYKDLVNFENENFKVVIPTCAEDFAKEAIAQKNCVRGYYESVLKEQTLVVFVRKKSDITKPYITCEINPSRKIIRQFLLKSNQRPTAQEDLNFYNEYDLHLSNQE